jgi:hypothetical protein
MDERRHDAVRIDRQIVRFQLIAGEQVEPVLLKCQLLGVEDEPHALRAGRLRRVIENKFRH